MADQIVSQLKLSRTVGYVAVMAWPEINTGG